jgi:hypothetical protein
MREAISDSEVSVGLFSALNKLASLVATAASSSHRRLSISDGNDPQTGNFLYHTVPTDDNALTGHITRCTNKFF